MIQESELERLGFHFQTRTPQVMRLPTISLNEKDVRADIASACVAQVKV